MCEVETVHETGGGEGNIAVSSNRSIGIPAIPAVHSWDERTENSANMLLISHEARNTLNQVFINLKSKTNFRLLTTLKSLIHF